MRQVWYVDDSAEGDKLEQLVKWWVDLNYHGPMYGCNPKPSETWFIVKPELPKLRIYFKIYR